MNNRSSAVRPLFTAVAIAVLLPAVTAVAVPVAAPAAIADPIIFNIDPNHSAVQFKVRHLGLSRVTGNFTVFEGSFEYDPDEPSRSKVSVTIETNSIDSGVERRDNHLRSADFLDVEVYPTLTFVSTAVHVVDAEHLEITGDLMIHGVTRSVVLATEFLGMAPRRGGRTSAFEATTTIDRHDFGLTWNSIQEGLQIVGDEITISIQVEAHTPSQ